MKTDFATHTLDRPMACAPERLFALVTDRAARARWSAPSEGMVVEIDECDIRPGGRERARCGPKDNPEFTVTADFHVVEAPDRLIFTETLEMGGAILSVCLATMEIAAAAGGSKLTVSLQIASLAGPEVAGEYQAGWSTALASLQRLAEQQET